MSSYPAYDGDLEVLGKVKVEYTTLNKFNFTYDLKGLGADCVDCGIHIHKGTSCATVNDPLGHYYNPLVFDEDPWNADTVYASSSDGSASGSLILSNGYTYDDNNGHTVVVHGAGGVRIACGVISDAPAANCFSPLNGCMSSYPAYDGDLEVLGKVKVEYTTFNRFKFTYDLKGLGADCVECGIHIHEGTSCATVNDPLGHYYNPLVYPEDPWNTVYTSSSDGSASGSYFLSNGYSNDENNGHTVVVHGAGGARIACGVITDTPVYNCFSPLSGCMSSYPAYDGDLEVLGKVKVEYTTLNKFNFTYDLKGLGADCVDCGIHIHKGTSCDTVNDPLGHYYNPLVLDEDPWNADTVYTSSSDGST